MNRQILIPTPTSVNNVSLSQGIGTFKSITPQNWISQPQGIGTYRSPTPPHHLYAKLGLCINGPPICSLAPQAHLWSRIPFSRTRGASAPWLISTWYPAPFLITNRYSISGWCQDLPISLYFPKYLFSVPTTFPSAIPTMIQLWLAASCERSLCVSKAPKGPMQYY